MGFLSFKRAFSELYPRITQSAALKEKHLLAKIVIQFPTTEAWRGKLIEKSAEHFYQTF